MSRLVERGSCAVAISSCSPRGSNGVARGAWRRARRRHAPRDRRDRSPGRDLACILRCQVDTARLVLHLLTIPAGERAARPTTATTARRAIVRRGVVDRGGNNNRARRGSGRGEGGGGRRAWRAGSTARSARRERIRRHTRSLVRARAPRRRGRGRRGQRKTWGKNELRFGPRAATPPRPRPRSRALTLSPQPSLARARTASCCCSRSGGRTRRSGGPRAEGTARLCRAARPP